ncbi:hypothetical protein B0J13DRAFT_580930 [Dactylonectria estremocensis]|uniref:NmrA-like domain-containing protein n=1 Tax=Dactylonectria estremocensis TaxID=1079267 RepID=A0A9P9FDC9_9HYPO|nr:hypothetical protein B0J13DRAFT_580930 [Dactylonectria estremocensis]
MGKVAVAGGSSNVGREVIDRILLRGNHEVVVLSRKGSDHEPINGVTWLTVDYDDQDSLSRAMKGVHTVLSFIAALDSESSARSQMNIIDACIANGVKRFAPSEWACPDKGAPPHYDYKATVRRYLEKVNNPVKTLEYCLFQPGFFTNYFANGRPTTKHFHMNDMFADFANRRALQVEDGGYPLTLTTVEDTAEVVAQALDYAGEWPKIGGIRGSQTTVAGLIGLGEKLRGKFKVDKVSYEASKAGTAELPWCPQLTHKGVPSEMRTEMSRHIALAYMTSFAEGAWSVSDEWNRLLPDYSFSSAEEYLRKVWMD